MANINDVFPAKYLKARDLQGKEPIVTIDRVEFEPVGRSRELKPVVYFRGKEKGIVLNKTNANKIIEISGSAETDAWPGTALKLYTTEADFGGETYDVVRIKTPNGARPTRRALPPPPPKPVVEPDPDSVLDVEDDEIPF